MKGVRVVAAEGMTLTGGSPAAASLGVAVYSSDAIGRLVADDVAGYIRYLTEHA